LPKPSGHFFAQTIWSLCFAQTIWQRPSRSFQIFGCPVRPHLDAFLRFGLVPIWKLGEGRVLKPVDGFTG
jgi:hypothetical protein